MPPRRNSDQGRKRKLSTSVKESESKLPTRIRYFDKDAISEHLHCPICQDVFNYPYALLCGHVFCHGCISEWLKHNRTCPECRVNVELRYAHKDLIAHKFLDSVPVYCSFLGCSWIGRMDSLQSHLTECECNPAKLPEYMRTSEQEENTVPGESSEPLRGTTALRMKLFKSEKKDLLNQAASGKVSILSGGSADLELRIPTLSDLTTDLVRSSDVIARNQAKDVHFVELSSDESDN
jgi:hypothetical protein